MAIKEIQINCVNLNQKMVISNNDGNIHFIILDGMRNQIVDIECDKQDIDDAWKMVKKKSKYKPDGTHYMSNKGVDLL